MQASVIKISSSLFRFRKNVFPSALTFNSLSTVKDFNEKEIKLFASKRQTPVSLKSLLKTGKGELLNKHSVSVSTGQNTDCSSSKAEDRKIQMQIACFLHHELPVRFAHRSAGLEASPILCKSATVRKVINLYKSSFTQLRECPAPNNEKNEQVFSRVIENICDVHSSTLLMMAKGAHEVRTMLHEDVNGFAEHDDVQQCLDDFYMSRTGFQILIGQYLALKHEHTARGERDLVGLISECASPRDIALQTIEDAAYICTRTHGDAPEVTIHGRTDLTFPYIASHIHYILLELLKNSMRATVEKHGIDNMPPIRIVIADGEDNEDVVIKISDEGGGIPRSIVKRTWSYLYTTADSSVLESMLNSDDAAGPGDFTNATPLAGLGYGLPIARNYARCFGGDMTLMSMEGYGTDSYIYLPRLGERDNSVV